MIVLGISAFFHDSAAAIISDGKVMAAAQEERFSRKKHDPSFPSNAIRWCLDSLSISGGKVDRVAFYEKPLLKFDRLLKTYLAFAPVGFRSFSEAMPQWMGAKLFQQKAMLRELAAIDEQLGLPEKLFFSEHHFSHAASAFFPSPFNEAAILTIDGVGEWATTSSGVGRGSNIVVDREIRFPHSIGLLYSAMTYYTGFKVNSGEYKVMGLAPYGEPRYANKIRENLIDIKPDGSFRLDVRYFDYCTGLRMTNERFEALFGGPARKPGEQLTQRHMDLAASIQTVTEEVILRLARSTAKESGQKNLCLAGGVALNCVANGKVLRDGCFERIWIQPAAGDAGGAIGAALAAYYSDSHQRREIPVRRDGMAGAYLGPKFSSDEVSRRLTKMGARFSLCDDSKIIDSTVAALEKGHAVGWFQGRAEFGPRALGARSILGDPRSPLMQRLLNLKVKYRESFRPFAPSVLHEDVEDWFDLTEESQYMLLVAGVKQSKRREMTDTQRALFGIDKLNVVRSDIPAVTHVDYSARVQTVHADTNPKYHSLLERFKEATGCPVLVNTSFNVRGEPIVGSPEDAFRCFMGTEIEYLAIENCWLRKDEQDHKSAARNYSASFEPD